MDVRTSKIINNYLNLLKARNIHIKKAYLFGSYAKNKQNRNSDIDIALVLKDMDDKDKFDLQVQLLLIASEIDTRIEPHPFTIDDFQILNPFATEIHNTGIEIKIQR